MAAIEVAIGNKSGATYVYDQESGSRKVILADGSEAPASVDAESGRVSLSGEIQYQTDNRNRIAGQISDYQGRVQIANEIIADPNSSAEEKARAKTTLSRSAFGLSNLNNQLNQKDELINTLKDIEAALPAAVKTVDNQAAKLAAEQQAKNSAKGQTAEQQVTNNTPPENPGTGTPPPTATEPQKLSDAEAAKLKNATSGKTEQAVTAATSPIPGIQGGVAPALTGGKSESAATQNEVSDAKKQEQASTVQGAGVSGQKTAEDTVKAEIATPIKNYNILHDYTSYTYRITLFFLEKKDYNSLAASPSTFTPKYALISSAGGYGNPVGPDIQNGDSYIRGVGRHPDFLDDFFIDNLSMTTIIGLNSKTKASNAVDINFTITEPHGMSLLDRLLSACESSEDRNPNYIDQPYLLQIDFLASPSDPAYNNAKDNNRLIDRKRVAIKLAELKIHPSTGGTVYQCKGIPYNHSAFSLTVASVPVPFSIEAGTVGEFFGSTADTANLFSTDTSLSTDERIESALKQWAQEIENVGGVAPSESELTARRKAISDALQYKSKSFTAAYNEHMEDIKRKQKGSKIAPTKIAFNIPDDIIASSPIVETDNSQAGDSRMIDPKQNLGSIDPNYKRTSVFQINSGTSVIDVIDRVLKNSNYIKNQIKNLKELQEIERAEQVYDTINGRQTVNPDRFRFLDWFKVVPQVVLNDFDFLRNAYSKTILYSIVPYKAANQYHPNFQKTKIKGQQAVRSYDYLYTGKNQDIISVNVDFDTSFYTQLSTYRDQVKRGGNNRSSDTDDVNASEYGLVESKTEKPNSLPVSIEYAGYNSSGGTMNAAQSPDAQIVADLSKSIYSSMRGDMLNIKLTIIGDPAFIKQDDIYYNPGSPVDYREFNLTGSQGALNVPINAKTGQIIFDREQIFVQFNVKNYVDINDSVGIVNKQTILSNGRATNGTFSGIYKLQRVDSTLSRGQFTQVLDLVRMPDTILQNEVAPTKDNPRLTDLNKTRQSVLDAIAPGSKVAPPAESPAPTVDPKLKTAANQPATNPTTQSTGTGTPTESSQPTSAAPDNANNTQTAPQEKASEPQSDTVPSLAKLSADYDRLFTSQTKKVTNTLAESIAQGDSLFEQLVVKFNEKIVAARSNPDKNSALIDEITAKLEREEYYVQMTYYTTNNIFFPAQKIDPYPDKFTSKITSTTQAIGDRVKSGSESINKLVTELRALPGGEDRYQTYLKSELPTIRKNAVKDAKAFVGG